ANWAQTISPANSNDNHAPEAAAVAEDAAVPTSTVTNILPTDRQKLDALRRELAALRGVLAEKLRDAA
ncbi:MAG: hypothetical protein ACK5QI_06360, partial [Alphaproteobacteria bacterium]